jgi:putative MATE family efflux protein
MKLNRYFGDQAFYKRLFSVAIPIIIQNGITNFVSLLDNIMIGQVGTVQMNGVSIANQLLFVFNLAIFGAEAGAGIFTAQYYGRGDHAAVRSTFRFKVLICTLLTAVGAGVFLLFGRELIQLYLMGEGNPADAAASLQHGLDYIGVMLVGLLPFAMSNAYSGTLRETGNGTVPMIAGIVAVLVNLGLNYVLIFGNFGAPAMGAVGAAWATVVSRYVELAIVAVWTHTNSGKVPFIRRAYRSVRIPGKLLRSMLVRGTPLVFSEMLWAVGVALQSQCFTMRGLDVVAATNIANTVNNLASVAFLALGNAVGILMGQMMGAGHTSQQLREANTKMLVASVLTSSIFGVVLAGVATVFPLLYNTTQEIRYLATQMVLVLALVKPFVGYCNAAYFTLRAGGRTDITFVYDCLYMWCLTVPLAFCLSRFTNIPIVPLYLIIQGTEMLKCVVGYVMIRSGIWIQNLTQ